MAKRKVVAEQANGGIEKVLKEEPEGSDDEDFDNLDVEFEWFDPLPEIDFHGIKSLLQQLFDVDSHILDLSALTELILAQPLLGSTVKVDGKETDAYAFLSVINLHEHKDKPFIQTLVQYLKSKANSNPALAPLSELLAQPTVPAIGLVLTERLINVPAEVVPPMYTMLLEEVQWAIEEKEPYQFSHYLILSKTYTEIASALDEEDDRPKKKKKAASTPETLYFHVEDEVLQRLAVCAGGYDYTTPQDNGHSDSKRAFQELGIRPQSHAILIEAPKFEATVKDVAQYLAPRG
ncbi:Mss4p nuclear export [Exophiala xenobiotica]|uniref:Protein BCP1 n=1 Tax=Lithohypha guttulata TaxID=1690604 RepID=A0ABR0K0R6_9EURO|nr:Mss4p nuclear export [Lithohypha guttulata]KAK5310935.1 Mss4p nuclear export [Exophiala xenobiotica]